MAMKRPRSSMIFLLPKYLERVVSIESWDSPQCSTNVIGAFQGYIGKGMKQKNLFYISPFSNNWIHIFAPKPMTITKLAFQFFMMNIEHKMKLKLTIVIGFGAKIWIQSPNLFQKFQQVWRQLHSLSIVDYPKLSMLTTLSRYAWNPK